MIIIGVVFYVLNDEDSYFPMDPATSLKPLFQRHRPTPDAIGPTHLNFDGVLKIYLNHLATQPGLFVVKHLYKNAPALVQNRAYCADW